VVSTFKFPRLYFSNRKCGNMGKIHKTWLHPSVISDAEIDVYIKIQKYSR
jgi:hypothetical protein